MHHIDIASFWPGYTVIAQALSANHHTLFLSLAPTCLPCCRRCLQLHAIDPDQRIRRVRERDLFDRQVWLQSACFAASTVCAVVASVNISTGSPLAPRLTRRMQCWIEALVQYLPSAMSASSLGSVGIIKEIDKAVCRPVWHHQLWGRCGGW